jgi:tripartite-type tricarboxylate transporter receptor subunit TctC
MERYRKGWHFYWFASCLVMGLAIFLSSEVLSEAKERYPSRSVDLIVAVSPGGGVDNGGRIIAENASKKFGVVVSIINPRDDECARGRA